VSLDLPDTWTDPDLWVLTCAPRSRMDETASLIESIGAPAVVVTTLPEPIPADFLGDDVTVLLFESDEINISKWWTRGLDWIASHYDDGEKWDVLLIESDARMTPRDITRIRRAMRDQDTIMAGGDWRHAMHGQALQVRRDNTAWVPDPSQADAGRIPGIACVISGEAGIRHDPEFRWWLADDDFEWQHRVNGGTLLVGGVAVNHVGTQGPLTGARLQAWEEDQVKFLAKWGGLPAQGGVPE